MKKALMICTVVFAFVAATSAQQVKLKGIVVDSVLREPYPFVYIDVLQGDSVIAKTHTDLDGLFSLKVPQGEYIMQFTALGCYRRAITLKAEKGAELDTIIMVVSDPFFYSDRTNNLAYPFGQTCPQELKIEGVEVKVKY